MKTGILTSSRADYGIYLPLLEKLKASAYFEVEIIAFGTHMSRNHGSTITEIEKDNYPVVHKIACLMSNDDEQSIATSYALTAFKFAEFWAKNTYDLVFCLGDRFEMSAAVQAGIPFGVKFAHLHGGEITLGAIDNVYRHQITLASTLHFTATEIFKEKVSKLVESENNIFVIGSLSLDSLNTFEPVKREILLQNFGVPNDEFALVTFHPETIVSTKNHEYAITMRLALLQISKSLNIVITMPNADSLGSIYRDEIIKLKKDVPNKIFIVENFGKKNYFSAMHYSKILIGNTSSAILEAASFGKHVVNVGDRQKGRLQSHNVVNVPFESLKISSAASTAVIKGDYLGQNVYVRNEPAAEILKILKDFK